MYLSSPLDPRFNDLLPKVTNSVNKQISTREPDYWDYATLLELAILDGDRGLAGKALSTVLASVRASWEAETTVYNLDLIATARERSGDDASWVRDIVEQLRETASPS